MQLISGFSKFTKEQRIEYLIKNTDLNTNLLNLLLQRNKTNKVDEILEGLSENYITNFSLPMGIAPNFIINNNYYNIPMVIEESSVVAAASHSAKFWALNGGFHCRVLGTKKSGQVYFTWNGTPEILQLDFPAIKKQLLKAVKPLITNMEKRGGGITDINLQYSEQTKEYYILNVQFETLDAMGANFINSCLETMASELTRWINHKYVSANKNAVIIMAILSNYTPNCIAECVVECNIDKLAGISEMLSPEEFAKKFEFAVHIAKHETSRAVTHNKGIFNGIDAVLLATGNDVRAVEANGHAYASREGKYTSLTDISTENGIFSYVLRVPLPLGTVGGITSIHPHVRLAMQLLHNPSAKELMMITAAAGLANNFSAVRSLITEGIQQGHMKLHLNNILQQCLASEFEKEKAMEFFADRQVSYNAVSGFLTEIRNTL